MEQSPDVGRCSQRILYLAQGLVHLPKAGASSTELCKSYIRRRYGCSPSLGSSVVPLTRVTLISFVEATEAVPMSVLAFLTSVVFATFAAANEVLYQRPHWLLLGGGVDAWVPPLVSGGRWRGVETGRSLVWGLPAASHYLTARTVRHWYTHYRDICGRRPDGRITAAHEQLAHRDLELRRRAELELGERG